MLPQGACPLGQPHVLIPAVLVIQTCPEGQQVLPQAVVPEGQPQVLTPAVLVRQTCPAGQHVPPQGGCPLGQPQVPLWQACPAGQQITVRMPAALKLAQICDWGQQLSLMHLVPSAQQTKAVPVALAQTCSSVQQVPLRQSCPRWQQVVVTTPLALVETQAFCPGGQPQEPSTQICPAGQQTTAVPAALAQTWELGQHLPLTQLDPSAQQMVVVTGGVPLVLVQSCACVQHLPLTQVCPWGQQVVMATPLTEPVHSVSPLGHAQAPWMQRCPWGQQTVPVEVTQGTSSLGHLQQPWMQTWPLGQGAALEQALSPLGQAQTPLTQLCPEGHTVPHAPQLRTSVAVLVHLPSQHVPEQQTNWKIDSPHSVLGAVALLHLAQMAAHRSCCHSARKRPQKVLQSTGVAALTLLPRPSQPMQLAPNTPPSRTRAWRRDRPLAMDFATSSKGFNMTVSFRVGEEDKLLAPWFHTLCLSQKRVLQQGS
jgi:hypothetical protein